MSEEIAKKTFIRNQTQSSVLDYGKLPPQAKDMEEAVIGAVMIDNTAISLIADIMVDECFYVDAHQRIWRAIRMLHKEKSPIDLLTVVEQLKQNEDLDAAGGPLKVAQISNCIGSSANIEYHARIVMEKYIQRKLISLSTESIKNAYEDSTDIGELLETSERNLKQLLAYTVTGKVETLPTQVDRALKQIEASASSSGNATIKSKHNSINQNFNGWQRGTLNIVAARPGMGKSAWHVSELCHLIKQDYNVASFNPEMSERQLFSRIFCNISEISNKNLKRFEFANKNDYASLCSEIDWLKTKERNLTVDFTGGVQLQHISNLCRKIKMERGLDVVFIDYLQLVKIDPATAKGINRDQYIGEITRELKSIAKNQDVCVIAFCQLNRAAEAKADKRPTMAELRESGNIENDADTISFLLRPEYYFEKDANGNTVYATTDQEQFKNICQFINAKNREDTTFEDEFRCFLGMSNFTDLTNQAPFKL